ncbi:MAG: DUF4105 domain-containing protein [Tenacibaculum sp.]|nr:DUF4105 domain-containing protein [Tenacibaculum sp.]
MFKKVFSILFFLVVTCGYNQNIKLTPLSEISVVTSGAGDKLYEKFGHTAIRIKDQSLNLDLIYNYGIFDFQQKNFYLKFTKGFMEYKLMKYPFHYALQSAEEDKRWMKQQVLNLTIKERNAFFNFLEQNSLPKNANYLYDPFFNNCATKPRDIIKHILKENLILSNVFTSNKSLRQLMNNEINQNTWGSLGINIALGSVLDKKATSEEYMYLPDYVYKGLSTSKIKRNGKTENLVKRTDILLNFKEKPFKSDVFSPFLFFLVLLIVGLFISFKDVKNKRRTKWFDFILLFSTGIIGVIIVFLWFFTNHSTAPNNFNVLWGFAPNVIIVFYLLKENQPKWIKKYIQFLLVLLMIIPIVWVLKIQLFNWTLIPFFVLLITRYLLLQKTLNS